MDYAKHFVAFLLIVLVAGCTEKNITNESDLGNIRGRVGYEDNTGFIPLEGVSVVIPGTSVAVLTDSSGNFLILNLPEGNYDLRISYYSYIKKINNVSVSPGHITKLPDVIISSTGPGYPNFLSLVAINLPNYGQQYLYKNDTTVIDIDRIGGDSLMLYGELDYYYYQSLYKDTTLTVKYGSDLFYIETSKGTFHLNLPVRENFCEIQIWEGYSAQPNNTEFKTTFIVTSVIDVQIRLYWNTGYGNSAGDCDIHLIDVEDQDSCWYKNPDPDWGIKGYYVDDPRLSDNTNVYGYDYANEYLYWDYAVNGSFLIKAIYFSNSFNPGEQVSAQLRLRIDGVDYYYDSPVDLSVGQVWTILEFDIPSKTITPINTIDGPVKQTAAKIVQ